MNGLDRLRGLSLFSGIGGIDLALAPWVRTVAYCEVDRYCQGVLLSRMRDGQLDRAPIWDDVRTLTADLLPEIDIIFGGFPCQDLSVAGNGAGLAGERSGLFFEIERLAREIRPSFVFLENVPAIRSRGADVVVGRLAELGYDCRWGVLSAFDVGAPHLRERWWLLAHSPNANGPDLRDAQQRQAGRWHDVQDGGSALARVDGAPQPLADAGGFGRNSGWRLDSETRQPESPVHAERRGEALADAAGIREREPSDKTDAEPTRREARDEPGDGGPHDPFGTGWWESERGIRRVAHGVPNRVDRLKSLGNGVVPSCAREAFKRLAGLKGGEG